MREKRQDTVEEQTYRQELIQLIRSTPWFMSVLETVRECNPPDWLVGAGVMRNLVWDHLHQYQTPTPLADIDVIFFDPQDVRPERDHMVQQQLVRRLPHVTWEATNQAAVHLWYEDVFGFSVSALHSSEEAVGTWPETATSVAVRLLPTDEVHIVAPCGLSSSSMIRFSLATSVYDTRVDHSLVDHDSSCRKRLAFLLICSLSCSLLVLSVVETGRQEAALDGCKAVQDWSYYESSTKVKPEKRSASI